MRAFCLLNALHTNVVSVGSLPHRVLSICLHRVPTARCVMIERLFQDLIKDRRHELERELAVLLDPVAHKFGFLWNDPAQIHNAEPGNQRGARLSADACV